MWAGTGVGVNLEEQTQAECESEAFLQKLAITRFCECEGGQLIGIHTGVEADVESLGEYPRAKVSPLLRRCRKAGHPQATHGSRLSRVGSTCGFEG